MHRDISGHLSWSKSSLLLNSYSLIVSGSANHSVQILSFPLVLAVKINPWDKSLTSQWQMHLWLWTTCFFFFFSCRSVSSTHTCACLTNKLICARVNVIFICKFCFDFFFLFFVVNVILYSDSKNFLTFLYHYSSKHVSNQEDFFLY